MTFELNVFQYDYYDDTHSQNLDKLVKLLKKTKEGSFSCASELCLTNFSYSDMRGAAKFSHESLEEILPLTNNKTVAFSIIEEKDGNFYNSAKIIHDNKIVHSQEKYRLFTLGEELKYFKAGDKEKFKIIDIGGIKVALLICFELRFVELWQILRGADILFAPSLWGKPRKEHLESITKTLAIINQCYVLLSNSSNDDMASSSGIITPFGKEFRDDSKDMISILGDIKEIETARRYLQMDI